MSDEKAVRVAEKDVSQERQKAMLAAHFKKLSRAKEEGRKVAYTSTRNGSKQIFVMDLDGGNVRQLTNEGNNDMPDWSRGQQP